MSRSTTILLVLGVLVTVAGLAAIPLPGPGLPIVAVGLPLVAVALVVGVLERRRLSRDEK